MQKIDPVKLGLLCIAGISMTAIVCGAILRSVEVITAGIGGAGLIGGWLGHSVTSGKDPGSDVPLKQTADKIIDEVKSPVFGATK